MESMYVVVTVALVASVCRSCMVREKAQTKNQASGKSDLMTCFSAQVEASQCSHIVQDPFPIDRYTCGAIDQLIECGHEFVDLGCSTSDWSEFVRRERAMAKFMYPDNKCYNDTSNNDTDLTYPCSPLTELEVNVLLDGCAGFMMARNPDLVRSPCQAAEEFSTKCIRRILPRLQL